MIKRLLHRLRLYTRRDLLDAEHAARQSAWVYGYDQGVFDTKIRGPMGRRRVNPLGAMPGRTADFANRTGFEAT